MKLCEALRANPYDEKKGNESAYVRYLRYTVDGLYNKSSEEVKKIWKEQSDEQAVEVCN